MISKDLDRITAALVSHALTVANEISSASLSNSARRQRQIQLCSALTHIERLAKLSKSSAGQSAGGPRSSATPTVNHIAHDFAVTPQTGADELTQAVALARHPNGFTCTCGSPATLFFERRAWRCPSCGRQTAIAVGTILQDSHLPWSVWFRAVAALSQNPGIGVRELSEVAGVKRIATVRRMMRKIAALDVNRPLRALDEIAAALVGSSA